MRRVSMLAMFVVFAIASCKKDSPPPGPKEAPISSGTVQADGVRRIDVEAGKDGYRPERIAGKPGEKLLLVFKRTVEGNCLAELKAPDGKVHELPMGKPVEVPITVPASGELAFACGMDMYKGVIVAQPAG
jgi:plastocyanin domain-containing protein